MVCEICAGADGMHALDCAALWPQQPQRTKGAKQSRITAADILAEMAETYRERNKVYGDNFRLVGPVMAALHPEGIELKTAADHELFHLYSLVIVKLSRFATSNCRHLDSIHDAAVYAAMIEAILKERAQ